MRCARTGLTGKGHNTVKGLWGQFWGKYGDYFQDPSLVLLLVPVLHASLFDSTQRAFPQMKTRHPKRHCNLQISIWCFFKPYTLNPKQDAPLPPGKKPEAREPADSEMRYGIQSFKEASHGKALECCRGPPSAHA